MAAPAREFALASPPTDGVSSLQFSPSDRGALLASSWDGTARVYDTASNALAAEVRLSPAPVLDACFAPDGRAVFAGGLDRVVRTFALAPGCAGVGPTTELGGHDDAVRCVAAAPAHGLVLTGSWDRTVKAWDPRAPGGGRPAAVLPTPDRVYSMSLVGDDSLAVATAGRHVLLFDLRGRALAAARESSLKHQTRVLRGFVGGGGWASGSVEGRVAIDFADPAPAAQAGKYAFKCHRAKPAAGGGDETVFPVHALAFHPVHGTFATGEQGWGVGWG